MKIAAVLAVALVTAVLIFALYRLARRALDSRDRDPYRGLSREQRREIAVRKHSIELTEQENRAYRQVFDIPEGDDRK